MRWPGRRCPHRLSGGQQQRVVLAQALLLGARVIVADEPTTSGKTTLARCLAGLHRDHDGEIPLDGTRLPRSLRHRSRDQRAAVQYDFQDARAAFDEHGHVLHQVARTAVRLRSTGERAVLDEASATLDRPGLPEEPAHRRPGELSGGELQRAPIARLDTYTRA
ncbi:hypothetical protein GCM10010320_54210 [Streptomyces caelestis]|nr:hypothetical protein GCM10010320_54210 [Streptomyces caelestis]